MHASNRRRRRAALVAASLLLPLLIAAAPAPDPAGAWTGSSTNREIALDTAGPLGPITVFGDSVLLGSALTSPTLADRLVEEGWGPVRMSAGQGYSTGRFHPNRPAITAPGWIERWRSQGWVTSDVVINLGANDSGLCRTDLQCSREAIEHVLDALGPGHRVWWPKITVFPFGEPRQHQDTWNQALDEIASERDDVWTWDWPLVMAAEGYSTYDGVHLSAAGYRRRSAHMAQQITDDLARAERTGDDAEPPTATGPPADYVPIGPTRVADTRVTGALGADDVAAVDLDGTVPDGTGSVAVNLTAAEADAAGFLTAHACDGSLPEASSVNFEAGATRAAQAVIPLSADGRLCVYTSAPAHVLVDIQGAFVPPDDGDTDDSGATRLTPLAEPQRALDTRATGRADVLEIDAPPGSSAVAVNLTAVGAAEPGFLSAAPCGEAPEVSNVNFGAAEAVAGSAFVPVGDDGRICVSTSTPVDVLVDLTGTFSTDGELRFVPAAPTRMIDTRDATGGWSPVHGRDQTIDARVAPPGAAAVTGTLTLAAPTRDGFSSADACAARPETSSVNAGARAAMANGLTTGISPEGRLCVTTSTVATTLFDTTGWWVSDEGVGDTSAGLRAATTTPKRRAASSADHSDAEPDAGPDLGPALDPARVGDVALAVPAEQRVYMVADSVGLGTSGMFDASFPPGWQATVDGTPAMFVEQLEQRYVWGAPAHVIGDHAIVAGGYNYPYWDPERFDRSIDSIIAAFTARGAEHVYWVTLREVKPQYISPGAWRQVQPYYWYFPTVNEHLERALLRHPNLTLVDWAANADQPGLTYDAIHLNSTGADLYVSLIRDAIEAAEQRAPAGSELRVEIPDADGVAAVALNLTTTRPRTPGFLSAYPCGGEVPEVSNHNHQRDETLAAAAVVPVPTEGPDAGAVCVRTETDSNVIVDVTGRFPAGAGIEPVPPRRLDDTRASAPGARQPADEPLRVRVAGVAGVPDDASAVALNVTAVNAEAPGFVTVAPCGDPLPPTSNVNYGTDGATPNLVVTAPGDGGEVCVVASTDTDLIVDVFAGFAADADLGLVTPERFSDSRPTGAPVPAGGTVELRVTDAAGIPDDAAGVMLNLTAAAPTGSGFVSAYPCDAGAPDASNLNMVAGADVANFVLVEPDTSGNVCVTTSATTHLIADVLGWAGDAFVGQAPQRLFDTR